MSAEVLLFGMGIDGDLPLDVTTPHAPYKGGQPAKIGTDGLDLATDHLDYIGVFKNDSTEDDVQGPQVDDVNSPEFQSASVIGGGQKVRFVQEVAGEVFQFPPSGGGGVWVAGQEIFLDGAGGNNWDNAAETAADAAIGRVVKAPASATDDLHVYLYMTSTSHVNS